MLNETTRTHARAVALLEVHSSVENLASRLAFNKLLAAEMTSDLRRQLPQLWQHTQNNFPMVLYSSTH